MNSDTIITFEPIRGCPTSWRLRANGIEVACATVRAMGASGGVYYFRREQGFVTLKEAHDLLKAHFAADGACKFRDDRKICELVEGGWNGKPCVPCECYRPRMEPQKDTNAAAAANTGDGK